MVSSRRKSAACNTSFPRIRRNSLAVKKGTKTTKTMTVYENPKNHAAYGGLKQDGIHKRFVVPALADWKALRNQHEFGQQPGIDHRKEQSLRIGVRTVTALLTQGRNPHLFLSRILAVRERPIIWLVSQPAGRFTDCSK